MNTSNIESLVFRLSMVSIPVTMLMTLSGLLVLPFVWELDQALLAAGALCVTYVLLLCFFLTKSYDIFQPLNFVLLSASIGITIRTIYLIFNADSQVAWILLNAQPIHALLPAILLLLIGIISFCGGYSFQLPPLPIGNFKIARHDCWDERRIFISIILLLLISTIGAIFFFRSIGFDLTMLTLDSISRKRFVVTDDFEVGYTSYSYYQRAADLNQTAFLVLLGWFSASRKSWKSFAGFSVILLFGISIILPFMTSSRGQLLWFVISAMMLWHYLRNQLSIKVVATMLACGLIVLATMLAFRGRDLGRIASFNLFTVAEDLIASRDLLDVTTTASIMAALEDGRLQYKYGSTYLTWVFAPIPRTLWQEKPVISVGTEIKEQVYGAGNRGGIPPGIIAEAFWNFGVLGVVVILFCFGVIAKAIYNTLCPTSLKNKNLIFIYATVAAPWLHKLTGSAFSMAIIDLLITITPIIIVLFFITKPTNLQVSQDYR